MLYIILATNKVISDFVIERNEVSSSSIYIHNIAIIPQMSPTTTILSISLIINILS